MLSFPIRHRLAGFYFFYYSIVGTFMPFWSLYLEDQGFNYSEIGILSSIAIITRFFAPFIWGWIADKSGKRMLLVRVATWMEACIWFMIFIIPNSFQAIALLMLILWTNRVDGGQLTPLVAENRNLALPQVTQFEADTAALIELVLEDV